MYIYIYIGISQRITRARLDSRHNTPSGVHIIEIRKRGRWLLLGKRERWSGKSMSIEGAFYPIFLRVIKYSARGSHAAAGTGGRGTIVAGVAERTRGIMGSNDEKPEGLYQWELVAVCPSNGTRAPPTMLDNALEEPMVNLILSRSRSRHSDSVSLLLSLSWLRLVS